MEIGDIWYVRPHFSSVGMVLRNVGGIKSQLSKMLVTTRNGH